MKTPLWLAGGVLALLVTLTLATTARSAPEPFVTPAVISASTPRVRAINKQSPGQKLDIKKSLVKGKVNIFDFYSVYCPPCMRIAPLLDKLTEKDPGIVVNKVDINRKGVTGIDWRSPLAQQYKLDSIPHFKVYDASGKLIAEGEAGFSYVIAALEKAGITE